MISVRFRPAADMPMIHVEIDPARHSIESVLTRAMERVFPGLVDKNLEAAREARFQGVMAERAERAAAKKVKR